MDKAASSATCPVPAGAPGGNAGAEQRAAPRVTLLIRAAKLVLRAGEFVCVIRDVSETGVSVRLFHDLPADEALELHMPAGAIYPIGRVWHRGNEAGFRFLCAPVAVEALVNEASDYPKRGLRLSVSLPVRLRSLAGEQMVRVENLSQQGARLACESLLAIDQAVQLELPDAGGKPRQVRAKVRWRRERHYGVVFDDTFTLSDFARLAARLQAPELLTG
jgi:hypothetical protein